MYAKKYEKLLKQANDAGDWNVCCVMALAITCRLPDYQASYDALKAQGRKLGKGTDGCDLMRAIQALGYKIDQLPVQRFNGSTVGRIAPQLKRGYYILLTARHGLAVVNGEVHDWIGSKSKRRVQYVLKVTKRKDGEPFYSIDGKEVKHEL